MPWSQRDYPDSMEVLEPEVREDAIEIANALVEEGYDEEEAIALAQAQAIGAAERRERSAGTGPSAGGQVPPLVEEAETMLADHEPEDDED